MLHVSILTKIQMKCQNMNLAHNNSEEVELCANSVFSVILNGQGNWNMMLHVSSSP